MQYFSRLLVTTAILLSPLMASGDTEIIKAQGQGVASTSDRSNTQAKLMSLRAARIDAQRKLLEEIEGVQLTALSTVKDLMLTNDVIGTRVKGMLKGAFEVSSDTTKDGEDWVSAIEMALCLTSDSAQCRGQINLTTLAKPYLEITPEKDLYSEQDLNATTNTTDSANPIEEQPLHTGLVLDATKLKVTPRLDIRVKTRNGKELYGPGYVADGKDWLHWATSVEQAQSFSEVVGANPMTITAMQLDAANHIVLTDLVAAGLFTENLKAGDFLATGNVIFVVANQEL